MLKPNLTSRRNPSKTAFNGHECLALNDDLSINLAPASHQAGDVNSTSTGNNICKLEHFSSRCGDIGCAVSFPPPDDEQGAEVESSVSTCYSKEVLRMGSLGLPALEDSSQERVIVIKDSESELDTNNDDESYFHDPKSSTQPYNDFSVADFLTDDKIEDKEYAINSKLVDGPKYQGSGLPRYELTLLTLGTSVRLRDL